MNIREEKSSRVKRVLSEKPLVNYYVLVIVEQDKDD